MIFDRQDAKIAKGHGATAHFLTGSTRFTGLGHSFAIVRRYFEPLAALVISRNTGKLFIASLSASAGDSTLEYLCATEFTDLFKGYTELVLQWECTGHLNMNAPDAELDQCPDFQQPDAQTAPLRPSKFCCVQRKFAQVVHMAEALSTGQKKF